MAAINRRIKTSIAIVIGCVPFLAAPTPDPCGACFGFWRDDLSIYEQLVHEAEVESEQVYRAQLGIVGGAAELVIEGVVDGVVCETYEESVECTFEALEDGVVTFEIAAGPDGAQTFLNLDPI